MPRFFRPLAAALLFRRLSRDLGRVAGALEAQTLLLARLADRLAPALPADSAADRATIRADTGISHLDATEAALAVDFVERMQRDTGHTPDEDELLIYLADEHTRDLATRLSTRDAELNRLTEDRR